MTPNVGTRVREELVRLVGDFYGEAMHDLDMRFRALAPGDEWKLERERQELMAAVDRMQDRLQLEVAVQARADGLVDWQAVISAVRHWATNEAEH